MDVILLVSIALWYYKWLDMISLLAALWNLLSNSRLSCCTMKKTQSSKISHTLASYCIWRLLLYTCMDLAEFAQLCLHHDQPWRDSEDSWCKASQSFAAVPLTLLSYSSDGNWTKHTCTNLAVFALESLPKMPSWSALRWTSYMQEMICVILSKMEILEALLV